MKEITIKVPDNTAYIHVLIGVLDDGTMNMMSYASNDKSITSMVLGDEKKENDG